MSNTKIVALQTFTEVGLEIGREYDSEFSQTIKEFFVQKGRASWVGSTYPKGLDEYENKSYGKGMIIIRYGCTYKARQNTGTIWDRTEWKLIEGIEDYIEGIIYDIANSVFHEGAIYKALVETSPTFILNEWDIKA